MALAAVLLVACADTGRVGGAPPAYFPPTTANPAYRSLTAALFITPQAREVVQKLTRFLDGVRVYNHLPGQSCVEFDPQRGLRDIEGMLQASFKSVVHLQQLGEVPPQPVDVVVVVSLAAQFANDNLGQKAGDQVTTELTLDLLSPDRSLLERLQASGSGQVPDPWTSTMIDESEARAFADLRTAFARSRALAQAVAAIEKHENDDPKKHHERALHAFDLGRFDEAIKEWQAAYDLAPRPKVLYNLARCYHRRGEINNSAADLREARHIYSRYQATAGEGDPDVGEDLRKLDELLAKAAP